jgi:molybdopterin-containing oxidoreductase family iron-sulfur binding subunit
MNRREFLLSAAALGLAACSPPLLRSAASRVGLWVDLARCRRLAGCVACQAACHRVHNVPDLPDPEEAVRWVSFTTFERALPAVVQPGLDDAVRTATLPLLCNHCDDPPCVRVCPAGATFAHPDGAVVVDAHRCVGCRYCMAACPYGARSFNFRDPRPYVVEVQPGYPCRERGVVEKCNLCVERRARGQVPACVEACPAGALYFGLVGVLAAASERDGRIILVRRPELGTSPRVFYVV